MTVVTSFRYVYVASRATGVFPFTPIFGKEFRLSDKLLSRGRCILAFMIIFRLIIIPLDLRFNINSASRTFMTFFRTLNCSYLNLLAAITYRNVFKFSKAACEWLNRMNRLYSDLQGNTRSLFTSNRFLVLYSLMFFFTTNTFAMVGFCINGKFISGPIAAVDGICFVLMLGFQNLYMCQLLNYMQLIKLSFTRINEILEKGGLQRERGKILKNKLRQLRAHHFTVTEFFYFVNSTFELNLLFFIFWAFCSTVFCCISTVIFDFNDSITFLVWMSYHPFQNWPIVYLCDTVSSESKKSAHHLHSLLIQNEEPDAKEEMEIFSLQLQHRPADFNVCGFFYLDYNLFLTVFGVVTTYIITYIQIQPTSFLNINDTFVELILQQKLPTQGQEFSHEFSIL